MFKMSRIVSASLLLVSGACGVSSGPGDRVSETSAALQAARNPFGVAETFDTTGAIDFTNPMFQQLGTNARSCATCHVPDMGWTLTGRGVARLFEDSEGLDPLFMVHDEGSRPDADISTEAARRATFGPTLLELGLTRFTRTVPATSEFTVVAVDDPSGFSTPARILNCRRPTPTANEARTSSILWTAGAQPDIGASVAGLFVGAANLHLQRDPANPTPVELQAAGRDFLMNLYFAQIIDRRAGRLDAAGAKGGPENVFLQPFTLGANDILSPAFTRRVFDIYDAWAVYDHDNRHGDCRNDPARGAARAAIYRGQAIFNNREFNISHVPGFNDVVGHDVVRGTCSSCHNVPNVGGHAVIRMIDTGTADAPNCDPALPRLTLQNKATLETRVVCDMGRGGNGVWADIAKFRVPPLRGLAARAPYFHDGQARTIAAVIRYYEHRFDLDLSGRERADLEAFLGAL
jgi:cytochrome c peroxidase